MRVDRFESANFRNLAGGSVEFGPALNVLIGENGQGKTNLLEAIYYFRFGRSFRAQSDVEMIQFGQPFCRMEVGTTFSDGRSERFACSMERRGASEQITRTIKISGQVLPRRSELAGRFPVFIEGNPFEHLVRRHRRMLDDESRVGLFHKAKQGPTGARFHRRLLIEAYPDLLVAVRKIETPGDVTVDECIGEARCEIDSSRWTFQR